MQHSRLLIWLLLLATVLVDAAALGLVRVDTWGPRRWPDPMLSVLFALAFGQVSVAVIWAGLGTQSAPWRLAGAFLVVALWSLVLSSTVPSGGGPGLSSSSYWVALLLTQTVFTLIPLSLARAARIRLATLPSSVLVDSGDTRLSRWQFSLGYLLAWITAVAVILGLFQYTVRYELLPTILDHWTEIGLLGTSHTAIALAALWAVLGNRRLILRLVILCLVTGTVTTTLSLLARGTDRAFAMALLSAVQAILVVGLLLVFRVAGYRIGMSGRAR